MRTFKDKSDELNDNPLHLTAEGLARLKERLARIKSSLPNLIAETERTAAYGDRSENDEYRDAKSSLRRANRQILIIQDQIKRAVIIKPNPKVSGRVQLGSTVVLETDGQQKIFQILGSHETNPAQGRISNQSPLGAALMNHAKGDAIVIQKADGTQTYHILEIR